MIVAGIDVGSINTKAVLLKDENILSYAVSPTGADPKLAAEDVFKKVLDSTNLSNQDVGYIVSTGYGRRVIDFGDKTVTEISCCARAARWIGSPIGKVRTIIDLGGQDMKVISLDEKGGVADFIMNDKCAAGTGRFLEVMANVLGMNLEDFGEISLRAKNPVKINSTCTVFAESEVISLIAQAKNTKEDIIAGIHYSIAERIVNMVRQLGEKEVIFFCGGGAKNKGLRKALEDRFETKIYVPEEPQIVIALGAALIAKETWNVR